MRDKTTITVTRDTAKKLKIIKIESDAKDINKVISTLLEENKNENTS